MFKSRKTLLTLTVSERLAYYERVELMKAFGALLAAPAVIALVGTFDPGAFGQIFRAAVTLALN